MNILQERFSRHKILSTALHAIGCRDSSPHGLLSASPLKEPCGFEAGDSDGVVERALSPASLLSDEDSRK